jgi:hypothetical protein
MKKNWWRIALSPEISSARKEFFKFKLGRFFAGILEASYWNQKRSVPVLYTAFCDHPEGNMLLDICDMLCDDSPTTPTSDH